MAVSKKEVLDFWFVDTAPSRWFTKDPDFDAAIKTRFLDTYHLARSGGHDDWAREAEGALALCLVLDQFPRNMFRDSPKAYETDFKAKEIALSALEKGFDGMLPPEKRAFLYLPFEHSETLEDQHKSVSLFAAMKDDMPEGYDYAVRHLALIERYGRFPHRNAALGRRNTPEEDAYLAMPGAGF